MAKYTVTHACGHEQAEQAEQERQAVFGLESALERHDLESAKIHAEKLRELTEKKLFTLPSLVDNAFSPVKVRVHSHDEAPSSPTGAMVVELPSKANENDPMLCRLDDFGAGEWDSGIRPTEGWVYEDEILKVLDFDRLKKKP